MMHDSSESDGSEKLCVQVPTINNLMLHILTRYAYTYTFWWTPTNSDNCTLKLRVIFHDFVRY